MREVSVSAVPIDRFALVLPPGRVALLRRGCRPDDLPAAERAARCGTSTPRRAGAAWPRCCRRCWPTGGAPVSRRAGSCSTGDARVLHRDQAAAQPAARLPGDGGPLGDADSDHYRDGAGAQPRGAGQHWCVPGDIVLLHDPQTAGLAGGAAAAGARTSSGAATSAATAPTSTPTAAWEFLRPFVEHADAFVFSRPEYAPAWCRPTRVWRHPARRSTRSARRTRRSTPARSTAALRHGRARRPAHGRRQPRRSRRRDGTHRHGPRPPRAARWTGPPPPADARAGRCRSAGGTGSRTWPGCSTGFADRAADRSPTTCT